MKWKCPKCGEITNIDDWVSTELPCGDCGSHSAAVCPKCEEEIDTVMDTLERYD